MNEDYHLRIAKEYNEPYRQVIAGFAAQRESMKTTANVLNIGQNTLRRDARRFNIRFAPQVEQRETSRKSSPKFKLRKPILYNGIIYLPSDPTSCMVYEKYDANERRKFIDAARRYYEV